MVEIIGQFQSGFCPMVESDGWRLAFVTYGPQYGPLREMKRHMDTDEAFVLIRGNAKLYTIDGNEIKVMNMNPENVYMIRKGTWHHLYLSSDAFLIAVENCNVTADSTERMERHY